MKNKQTLIWYATVVVAILIGLPTLEWLGVPRLSDVLITTIGVPTFFKSILVLIFTLIMIMVFIRLLKGSQIKASKKDHTM